MVDENGDEEEQRVLLHHAPLEVGTGVVHQVTAGQRDDGQCALDLVLVQDLKVFLEEQVLLDLQEVCVVR